MSGHGNRTKLGRGGWPGLPDFCTPFGTGIARPPTTTRLPYSLRACEAASSGSAWWPIAGHGRILAAEQLGLAEVPVLPVTHLTPAEKRAYILADNRLAEKAGWDKEILAIELQALIDFDFEVEITGFELAEIDLILDEDRAKWSGTESEAADVVPPSSTGPTITKRGDVWQLGAHRLICGEARDPEALVTLLEGEEVDLIFADPPYNVAVDGHVGGLGKLKHREFAFASGEMSPSEFITFLREALAPAAARCCEGAITYEGASGPWLDLPQRFGSSHRSRQTS